jgi:hypothetical protein
MTDSVSIDKRFHGPCESGNGGYSCGLVGKFIEGDAAVRLRVPPPLDTPMDVRVKHGCVELVNNDELVATGKSATVEIDIPEPPGFADAQVASRRYRGFESHFYPSCFVCGPEREPGDGLRIFAGPIEHTDGPDGLVAATWDPMYHLRILLARYRPSISGQPSIAPVLMHSRNPPTVLFCWVNSLFQSGVRSQLVRNVSC